MSRWRLSVEFCGPDGETTIYGIDLPADESPASTAAGLEQQMRTFDYYVSRSRMEFYHAVMKHAEEQWGRR